MTYPEISFRPYRRIFTKALRTSRGTWSVREGFLLRIEQEGRVGYGEVAPIPEFGSETLEVARRFLESLEADPSQAVPESLPCCAFARSSALFDCGTEPKDYAVAGLLPAGEAAIHIAAKKSELGYRTLKWKVGVEPMQKEQEIFQAIVESAPKDIRLRLDANGAWSAKELESWVTFLQPFGERIEFIEQPMATGQEAEMARLAAESGIAIALDESLNGLDGLHWLNAWEGPLVIKPLLMGDCGRLIQRLQLLADRVVLSSVFETGVGVLNVLHLADALPGLNRAFGFDTVNFSDTLSGRETARLLRTEDRAGIDPEAIWKQNTQSM